MRNATMYGVGVALLSLLLFLVIFTLYPGKTITKTDNTVATSSTSDKKTEKPPAKENKSGLKAEPEKKPPVKSKTENSTTGPSASGNGSSILYILLTILALSQFASMMIIIYLFNWRYRVSDRQVSVVPEEVLKSLFGQEKELKKFAAYSIDSIQKSAKDRQSLEADLKELQNIFEIFQENLNKKDQEIERYKNGYDTAIYKKFLTRFTRFYIELRKEAEAPENAHSAEVLEDMLELLEDALQECNVILRTPQTLQSAEEYKDITNGNHKYKTTDNPELHGKIAEVITPAFMLDTHSGEETLREANVAVYVYKNSEAV